jgi:hypothetical protein
MNLWLRLELAASVELAEKGAHKRSQSRSRPNPGAAANRSIRGDIRRGDFAPPRAGLQDRRIPSTTSQLLTYGRSPAAFERAARSRRRCGSTVARCASATGLGTRPSPRFGAAALQKAQALTASSTMF